MARRDPVKFIGVIALVIMICVLALSGYPLSSQFKAQGSSGDTVTYATTGIHTTYLVTTNAAGQTVTTAIVTSGTYVQTTTTQAASSAIVTTVITGQTTTQTTTTSAPSSWLTITIDGIFKLLDPNGNLITSQTYELVTETGTAADSLALDATYQVTGAGYDPSTLKVDCSSSGQTAQPSATDPNTPEIVNQGKVKDWLGLTSQSGHLTLASKITDLTGTKSWDHSRKLTPTLSIMCSASAKVASGYTYALADGTPSSTVSATVGPIIGLASLKWNEPQPAPAPGAPAPTCAGCVSDVTATTSPSPTYSASVATQGRFRAEHDKPDTTVGGSFSKLVEAFHEAHPDISHIQLVGVIPTIEVFGADEASAPIVQALLLPTLATTIGLVVVFFLFRRKKKRRM